MQIFVNQSIMHYLSHTLTVFASHGDKTWAQLTGSTFSGKRHFEWLNSKSVMLIHFLSFINPNFFINQNCRLSQNWELPFHKKCANDKLPSSFTILFAFSSKSQNYQTSSSSKKTQYHMEKTLLQIWL